MTDAMRRETGVEDRPSAEAGIMTFLPLPPSSPSSSAPRFSGMFHSKSRADEAGVAYPVPGPPLRPAMAAPGGGTGRCLAALCLRWARLRSIIRLCARRAAEAWRWWDPGGACASAACACACGCCFRGGCLCGGCRRCFGRCCCCGRWRGWGLAKSADSSSVGADIASPPKCESIFPRLFVLAVEVDEKLPWLEFRLCLLCLLLPLEDPAELPEA
mmetsp:Transcript_45701/g.84834  ORF Transcript_45701/g.84834 Transcript_45701/m.84834 type:complete len:215 (-) Transcript_45701:1935-2579(-)